MSVELPVLEVLPDLCAALRKDGVGVLIAPPGAGKTTAVAPALLAEEWCAGEIVVTSPRRVAARAAAERIAETLGEQPGETVGYQTRMDSKVSSRTRIRFVTEAILVNRLIGDPELPGVSAILFDEAHERHLDSDLGPGAGAGDARHPARGSSPSGDVGDDRWRAFCPPARQKVRR
jgi:ATP-dependent helicase HrpB